MILCKYLHNNSTRDPFDKQIRKLLESGEVTLTLILFKKLEN